MGFSNDAPGNRTVSNGEMVNGHATNGATTNGDNAGLPPLYGHCVDDYRPMKVICIGAGISGICAAIRFNQRIQNLDFTIYEKNADIGGTWFENKYPGVRCDIPSHSYQYTFENNSQWSEYYSSGPEIQRYLQRTARKYGVYKYVKFRYELKGATWQAEEGKWELKLEDLGTGRVSSRPNYSDASTNPVVDIHGYLRHLCERNRNSQQVEVARHTRIGDFRGEDSPHR